MSFAESTEGARRTSTRNPRRRQRPESDSFASQPRRKRSKISADMFASAAAGIEPEEEEEEQQQQQQETRPAAAKQNGHAAAANGYATRRSQRKASVQPAETGVAAAPAAAAAAAAVGTGAPQMEVAVRGGKKTAAKRAAKSDGSTVLAQNEHYSVRHVPSTPDILRNSASDYRGSILQSPPLALAITHERAYIWDYTSPVPVAHPRTFDVTPPTRATDPLPIGTLVTHSNTKAIGLLVIGSTTGRVTYWENIDTAESLSLFQQRNTGVEGSLGNLFGGESVVHVVPAEHAGFIVTLSSGRIAQISLADAQGKAQVSAHFLRSNEAASGTGIFGSIKSTFGLGSWKRDVVSVHTRSLGARREIEVIAATETGQIQVWDLPWSGQSVYKGSFDFRDMLQQKLYSARYSTSPTQPPSRDRPVKVLDVAMTPAHPRGDELVAAKQDAPLDLMLLVQAEERAELGPSYAIVNIVMSGNKARLERLIPVRTETALWQGDQRPRLFLPKPGHTAYIVTGQQIVLASVQAPVDDSPEAQLRGDMDADAPLFQDALWLRTSRHYAIEGCCEEDLAESRGASACAVFVKGYGLARVVVNDPSPTTRSRPTAKSKIEQAVFYGTMSDNIFDLAREAKSTDQYHIEDVEDAACQLSREILCSTTPYIPATATTVDANLASRVKASRALITYLMNNYPGMTRATRRRLMSDAEKLNAAQALWAMFDQALSTATKDRPRPTLLPLCIKAMAVKSGKEMSKMVQSAVSTKSSQAQEDSDPIRHWFISEVEHITGLRQMALQFITQMYDTGKYENLMRFISEADDIIFSLYDTVFAFRTDNAEVYGFSYASMAEGILEEAGEDLPEPWTSNVDVFNMFNKFIDVARDYTVIYFDKPTDNGKAFIEKVVRENVKLVTILCLLYRERIAHVTVNDGGKGLQYVEAFADSFVAARGHHLRFLSKIGQAGSGIALAEKYHDLETLVRLVMSEQEYLVDTINQQALDRTQKALIQKRIDDLEQHHVQRYFKDIGADFANKFFDLHLERSRSYGLLLQANKYREPLTNYLRAEKARGRLGWIHDVLRESDYAEASQALSSLAREQENRIWNKNVELSLGKLASLAVQEETGTAPAALLQQQEDDLVIVGIQRELKASFEPILFAAVDIEAEVQLVSDAYAITMKRRLPAFFNMIEIAIEDLLKHKVLSPERLIDVLTLIDTASIEAPESDITGQEFYLALKVLLAAKKDIDSQIFDVLQRLIWKRCWLAEDWEIVNDTKRKSEKFVQAVVRDTTVCKTIALCIKNSLFAPGTGLTPLSPTETLGAGCDRDDIAYRFHVDDLIEPILHDNRTQDAELLKLIEPRRLEHWSGICREQGKVLVEEEVNARVGEESRQEAISEAWKLKERNEGVVLSGDGGVYGGEDGFVDGGDYGNGDGHDEQQQQSREKDGRGRRGDEDGDVDMS